jgi:hypothetical protein
MNMQFWHPGAEAQTSPEDYRNINMLTIISKLVLALVLCVVAMVASFF